MDYFQIGHQIISYYSVVLAGVGSFFNLLSVYICSREALRQTPTFVFLMFMILIDTFSLYFWNFMDYFITFHGRPIMDFSVGDCKTQLFFQMFSLQASAYILVAISAERYLSIKIKKWRARFFKAKHAVFTSLAIIFFFFILNLHVLVTTNFDRTNNTAVYGACVASATYRMWRPIHTYIYSMVPFLILLSLNILFIREVVKSRSKVSSVGATSKNKQKTMTISIISLTVGFICFTGPFAFIGGYFSAVLLYSEEGRLLLFSAIALAFTYHAANFPILIVTNKKFSRTFKQIIKTITGKNKIETMQTSLKTDHET